VLHSASTNTTCFLVPSNLTLFLCSHALNLKKCPNKVRRNLVPRHMDPLHSRGVSCHYNPEPPDFKFAILTTLGDERHCPIVAEHELHMRSSATAFVQMTGESLFLISVAPSI
jgi:hypothetical protein